jgi:hypothetical protein
METTLPGLNALETAVLNAISGQEVAQRATLEEQFAKAIVVRRENSGAGFFTHLEVDRSLAPLTDGKRVIGNVTAEIEGFKDPVLFMLFTKDGYADFLEAATIDDHSENIDFSTVLFRIL